MSSYLSWHCAAHVVVCIGSPNRLNHQVSLQDRLLLALHTVFCFLCDKLLSYVFTFPSVTLPPGSTRTRIDHDKTWRVTSTEPYNQRASRLVGNDGFSNCQLSFSSNKLKAVLAAQEDDRALQDSTEDNPTAAKQKVSGRRLKPTPLPYGRGCVRPKQHIVMIKRYTISASKMEDLRSPPLRTFQRVCRDHPAQRSKCSSSQQRCSHGP